MSKNFSLLSAPTPIKYISKGRKFLCSLIDTNIKEGDCFDAWKFVARNFANGSVQIQSINVYQSYSPVPHVESFIINIAIVAMNISTARILDVINAFNNTNVTIHERVCVSPPPYYLYCFEISNPNVTLNIYEGQFCLQCMSGIQGTKPSGKQCNQLFYAVITIIKYKKSTIDHDIYIKVFYD